jgi:hypothetical protein
MMKRFVRIVAVCVFVFTAATVMLAQTDGRIGTWKLNPAKSKYSPGPAYKSETRTYEAAGSGQKLSVQRIAGDGKSESYGYSLNLDGKDSPVTGQGPNGADTVSVKRLDANKTDSTWKKGGKEIFKSMTEISKDGKVLTVTSKGNNAAGQPINNVALYDRQ